MKTSESTANISKALAKAQAEAPGIQKSGNNTFDKYRYANLEDYIDGVKPVLTANKLSMMFSCDAIESLPGRTTQRGGTEHVSRLMLSARLTHESGEWVEITVPGEGQDRGDKGVYKAMTGARKYAVACLLGLATTDDTEADGRPEATERNGTRQTEPAPPKPVDELRKAQNDFTTAVKKWTGFKGAEDVVAARQQLAMSLYNKPAKDMTIEELGAGTAFVNGHLEKKTDFLEWSKA